MVDNFLQIRGLLKFENPGDFYFVQVIQRKKDHKEENKRLGRNNNARLIKAFYIHSLEEFDEHTPEIKVLSQATNSRAGINLNVRNDKKVAIEMMVQLAHAIQCENYNVDRLYNTVCGDLKSDDRFWVVDVDFEEGVDASLIASETITVIDSLRPVGKKLIAEIPTKNGVHLITKPFDSERFKELSKIDFHKNNPTVLYIS